MPCYTSSPSIRKRLVIPLNDRRAPRVHRSLDDPSPMNRSASRIDVDAVARDFGVEL